MEGIRFTNITFGFEDQLLFEKNEIFLGAGKLNLLVGDSGIGKTTLLNLFSKKIKAYSISCSLSDWHKFNEDDLSSQLISYQLINHGFMNNLTVQQNIEETKHCFSSYRQKELLDIFDFNKHLNKYPKQLSGGQKRILTIILAIMKDLPILFLDEPTSSLDHQVKEKFMEFLKKYASEGHIVVVATNDVEILEYADEIIKIEERKITQSDYEGYSEFKPKLNHEKYQYRFKTILYKQKWHKLILGLLVVSMAVFLCNSLKSFSDTYYIGNSNIEVFEKTYVNTSYVYQETMIGSDTYENFAPILDDDLKNFLLNHNDVEKVYPYYAIPVGELYSGAYDDGTYVKEMYISNDSIGSIEITNNNLPFIEFYYPEQLAGDHVYISEVFLNGYQLSLEDVKNVLIDVAFPVGVEDGDIVQTLNDSNGNSMDIDVQSIKRIYQKNTISLTIDDTFLLRGEMYNYSNVPMIYAPFSLLETWINTTDIPTNAYVIILKDNESIDDLKNDLLMYDENLILFYPANANVEYIAKNKMIIQDSMMNHVGIIAGCIAIVSLFLILFETMNKNDYLYLRYSGLSKKSYIKYRLLDSGLTLLSMVVLSLIYLIFSNVTSLVFEILLMTYMLFLLAPLTICYLFMYIKYKKYVGSQKY